MRWKLFYNSPKSPLQSSHLLRSFASVTVLRIPYVPLQEPYGP